jgi:hypothetical protein
MPRNKPQKGAGPEKKPASKRNGTPLGNGGEYHQKAGGKHPPLTTNQGVPIADNQNSLRASERGPTLLEDFILREKIMHFDHERIPERIVHARGTGAHGRFTLNKSLSRYTTARAVHRGRSRDACLRPPVDGRGWLRIDRHAARRQRFRGEVLHRRGELRPRWQQHPGVLHPGRHEIPGPCPRDQDGTGQRDPPGHGRPRHILGLHLAHA